MDFYVSEHLKRAEPEIILKGELKGELEALEQVWPCPNCWPLALEVIEAFVRHFQRLPYSKSQSFSEPAGLARLGLMIAAAALRFASAVTFNFQAGCRELEEEKEQRSFILLISALFSRAATTLRTFEVKGVSSGKANIDTWQPSEDLFSWLEGKDEKSLRLFFKEESEEVNLFLLSRIFHEIVPKAVFDLISKHEDKRAPDFTLAAATNRLAEAKYAQKRLFSLLERSVDYVLESERLTTVNESTVNALTAYRVVLTVSELFKTTWERRNPAVKDSLKIKDGELYLLYPAAFDLIAEELSKRYPHNRVNAIEVFQSLFMQNLIGLDKEVQELLKDFYEDPSLKGIAGKRAKFSAKLLNLPTFLSKNSLWYEDLAQSVPQKAEEKIDPASQAAALRAEALKEEEKQNEIEPVKNKKEPRKLKNVVKKAQDSEAAEERFAQDKEQADRQKEIREAERLNNLAPIQADLFKTKNESVKKVNEKPKASETTEESPAGKKIEKEKQTEGTQAKSVRALESIRLALGSESWIELNEENSSKGDEKIKTFFEGRTLLNRARLKAALKLLEKSGAVCCFSRGGHWLCYLENSSKDKTNEQSVKGDTSDLKKENAL